VGVRGGTALVFVLTGFFIGKPPGDSVPPPQAFASVVVRASNPISV